MQKKEQDKLVSVVVPLYNQERYVKECLDSIIGQTYSNLDIIIVDNNSTDNSLKICKKIAKKDNRIRVISEIKQGISYARNRGIDEAKGVFIAFVDSDDKLDKEYLKTMLNEAKQHVMPVCEMNIWYKNGLKRIGITNTNSDDRYKKIEEISVGGYLWNKLYDRKIIMDNNLRFDTEAFVQEDMLFNYNYLKFVRGLRIINIPLYNYRMRKSSSVRKKEDIKTLKKIEDFCKRERIDSRNVKYSIIRAYLINGVKNRELKRRLWRFLVDPRNRLSAKAKLIARCLMKNNKKTKNILFE